MVTGHKDKEKFIVQKIKTKDFERRASNVTTFAYICTRISKTTQQKNYYYEAKDLSRTIVVRQPADSRVGSADDWMQHRY